MDLNACVPQGCCLGPLLFTHSLTFLWLFPLFIRGRHSVMNRPLLSLHSEISLCCFSRCSQASLNVNMHFGVVVWTVKTAVFECDDVCLARSACLALFFNKDYSIALFFVCSYACTAVSNVRSVK